MRQGKPNKRNKRNTRVQGRQKWVVVALALLMVAAVVLIGFLLTQTTQMKLDAPVYQFFMSERVEYDTGTKLTHGPYNVVFQQAGQRSDGDDSPIYTTEGQGMILPDDMYWLDPSTGRELWIPAFSRLNIDESGAVWCTDGRKEVRLEGGFLSDAAGTFVFLESTTLEWNGRRDEVDVFSFYSIAADEQIRVYDYKTGDLVSETAVKGQTVGTSVRGYRIDFTAGIYTGADGSRRLLVADPTLLPDLFQSQ